MSGEVPLRVGIDVSAIPANPAGAGRYVVELVRALARRDDVVLDLFARRGDAVRWSEYAPGGDHTVLPVAPSSRGRRVAYGELVLGRVARRARPRIAAFHGPHYSLPRTRPGPEVVTVHDLTLFEHPEWHERSKVAFFRAAMRRAAQRADAIIVLSEGDKTRVVEHFSPRGVIAVIPHGVDQVRFTPSEPRPGSDAAARARLGVAQPYVLHLGTIEPRKNLPVLIAAFERLLVDDPTLRLVLAGGAGWGTDALEAALAASTCADSVERLGYVDDDAVPALLRGAAAVAYPSSAEGFGLPVLEALACGAPTVTTTGSVMETVAGDAALLAPAGDSARLADALAAAIAGGISGARRRERGLQRAHAFTWEASAETHVATYRAVAISGSGLT
jgi:glycosyltransferase involved in cell wall biosynthesis